MKLSILSISLLLLCCMPAAPAWADTVNIFDLSQDIPAVQVLHANGVDVTAQRVQVLADSHDDFLHFRLLINNFGSGDLAYTDLFEDSGLTVLSDRILVYFDPNAQQDGGLEVVFGSDPFIPDCVLNGIQCTFNYPYDAQENGQLQHVADAFNTNIGDGTYIFFAQSDVETTTPEPTTLILLATGFAGGFFRRKLHSNLDGRQSGRGDYSLGRPSSLARIPRL